MLLARKGYRVLLVERARIPSDTMRNHFIQQGGIGRLQRWGLLERLAGTGCPPIRSHTIDFGDFPLTIPVETADGIAGDYGPRRYILDGILVTASGEAGPDVRDRYSVRKLLVEDGTVTGIRGASATGGETIERARIVVGADGLHSLVARTMEAPVYDAHPSLTCSYYSYFEDVSLADMSFSITKRTFAIAFTTHSGLHCVAVQVPIEQFAAFRTDIEGMFFRSLAVAPHIAGLVRPECRAEKWRGTADVPNFFRKPWGNGWALVGDAGYHKDPLTAQGISDAFRDAELLSGAIDDGFSGRRPLQEALAAYERERNEVAEPLYARAVGGARFQPIPDEVYQARAAARAARTECA
jgi:2-polyprenyl-6-methoxyphenol hydroxylase-like FAD-dependent oxidoreductase